MAKFKVGAVVKPVPCDDGYLHSQLDIHSTYTVEGYTGRFVNVSGEFLAGGNGSEWCEDWFELVAPTNSTTAESLRNFILEVRSKREALQKEILRLDEQEKEAVEKLKEQGFVLYGDNVSKETAATENKAVLYAEDIEEDMTNPENWEVGDLFVRCEGDGTDQFGVGEIVRLTDNSETSYFRYEYLDGRDYWHVKSVNVKFHSRPVK